MHHVEPQLGMRNEHVLKQEWIAEPDPVGRRANVWCTGRSGPDVNRHRKVELFG